MEAEPRHALEAGGRQPPAAQSAVQSPDPSPPPLRAAASVAAGASEVSASLRRSQLKQEPFAPLAGRLAPWAGVWPGLGGFRRFGLRPWRGTPNAGGGEGDPEGDSEGGSGGVRNLPILSPGISPANTRQGRKNKACLCAMISGPVAAAQTPPIARARPRIRLRAARRPGVSAAPIILVPSPNTPDPPPPHSAAAEQHSALAVRYRRCRSGPVPTVIRGFGGLRVQAVLILLTCFDHSTSIHTS